MSTVSKIVILGTATGAVAWLPLVWFEAIPIPVREPRTSSQVLVAPKPPDRMATTLDTRPAAENTKSVVPNDEPEKLPISAGPLSDSSVAALPLPPEEPPTIARLGEEGELRPQKTVASSVELRQPERVAVANFESPVVAPTAEGEPGTIRLMHELNDADTDTTERAARELAARGFTDLHVQLARRLTSPDIAQRSSLAAELPRVAGIDARLWLTWLLRDEEAEVR